MPSQRLIYPRLYLFTRLYLGRLHDRRPPRQGPPLLGRIPYSDHAANLPTKMVGVID